MMSEYEKSVHAKDSDMWGNNLRTPPKPAVPIDEMKKMLTDPTWRLRLPWVQRDNHSCDAGIVNSEGVRVLAINGIGAHDSQDEIDYLLAAACHVPGLLARIAELEAELKAKC